MTADRPSAPAPAPLDRVLAADPPPFALLHRPESGAAEQLEVLLGEVVEVAALDDLPLPEAPDGAPGRHEVLALIPYRQIAERGYAAVDDGTPLLAMTVREQDSVPLAEALRRIPDVPAPLHGARFDVDDETYARTVRRVVEEEIGRGEGANFVIRRSFVADIGGYTPAVALAFFRRLVEREQGAYWTFIVHTGDRTLVGATPERHISVAGGTAVMNPISGTYRYPPSGPTLQTLLEFLADRKESDELYMVLDEELKMMARICESGGRVIGPRLKEMARLAHTEYFIEGRTVRDVREVLRETLFAPTVTGSPLESACRVIRRHEAGGRGYYSGVAALIGRDTDGARRLDSSILIRTADIDRSGRLSIGVGATLVRGSDPWSEVAETRAKAEGLLAALSPRPRRFADHPDVRRALESRNEDIAGFWLRDEAAAQRRSAQAAADAPARGRGPALAGRTALVVDAEDTFTSMIAHLLRSMGMAVTVRRFDEPYCLDGHDLVVMGPGPGDPRDDALAKIAHLRADLRRLLDTGRPFVAVCLSHQVLSGLLGLELVRRDVPHQGVQREIDLFGRQVRVGFYNTFVARCDEDKAEAPTVPGVVEVSRDPATGEVHALRGTGFCSMQFHPESVLTEDGTGILRDALVHVLAGAPAPAAALV
ncbi:anthranilate synthase family protein [Streptomyces antimicrobicus]|uniref:anthranilate synthase n=1 Tax=Streptomyces antimicrobicus TaxID=2883108 RepID=A0ABS8B021_9ACTN|nr:anthranilate synthase family protein [Streptomyces antimicrobicus]MCB5177952.1 anthranilate synthase family protein [Streptomyces antimicrobicus]